MIWDYVIVGSGLTGSVIARRLHDSGYKVLIVERRSHWGGNVHDSTHPCGIPIHTYGPHYFRTGSNVIWDFVNRFSSFTGFEAELRSEVDSGFEHWPVTIGYIKRLVGESWQPSFKGDPNNLEEASLAIMPRIIYEKFIKEYNEKQWGMPATALPASLARRFVVRHDNETRLTPLKYQGIPRDGYTAMMKNMLKGIPLLLNCDFLSNREAFIFKHRLIYTGPIDEFFDYSLGRLEWRAQSREHEYLPDLDYALPCVQVNNPSHARGKHIRTLEWKHMLPSLYASKIQGTVITRETTYSPNNPDNYEYPVPTAMNRSLHAMYMERAKTMPELVVAGRLGEYRYYDMDQAIAKALTIAKKLLERG